MTLPPWLTAAQAGDRDAWITIYETHAPAVLGYLRTQYAAQAEDLCADVFVGAVRDISQFSGDSEDLRRWLLRIARNRVIDLRRSEAVRPQTSVYDVPDVPSRDVIEDDVADRMSGSDRLESLLAPLTPDQRAVLYLRFVLDLDTRDTARTLGISSAAVKMLQHRGQRAIARNLGKKPPT